MKLGRTVGVALNSITCARRVASFGQDGAPFAVGAPLRANANQ